MEAMFEEGWTDVPPTKPGWYWIVRRDMKPMPVEVFWAEYDPERAPLSTALVKPNAQVSVLAWRERLARPSEHYPMAKVQYWGPRLPDVEVPDHIKTVLGLQGVSGRVAEPAAPNELNNSKRLRAGQDVSITVGPSEATHEELKKRLGLQGSGAKYVVDGDQDK